MAALLTLACSPLVVAVPSFRNLLRRSHVSSASNELLARLTARTETINRGQLVSMCPSGNGEGTRTDVGAYESGWIVYT